MPKAKLTFETASKQIKEKQPHLTLIIFNGRDNICKFLDEEYGEFEGVYKRVIYAYKMHPNRAQINKLKAYDNPERLIKTKKTNLKRYGVENPAQHKEIKEKIKQTNLYKYGSICSLQNNKVKEKTKQTCLVKYGVELASKSNNVRNKIKKTNIEKYGCSSPFGNKDVQDKSKQTNLEKYGVEYTLQDKNIRETIKETNIEKYGCETPFGNKDIQNKVKQTNLDKYGVENPFRNKEVQKKIKQTNIEKYGAEYYLQSKCYQEYLLENNLCHNINGQSLKEYYNNSKLSDKLAYSTVQRNYNKYGDTALSIEHYDELSGKSKIANLWLEQIEKELGYDLLKEYPFDPDNKALKADGYDPKTNTIYEFYGDYWHGNLKVFAADLEHNIKNITMQELYDKTIEREEKIKKLGYNLIIRWENDFKLNIV